MAVVAAELYAKFIANYFPARYFSEPAVLHMQFKFVAAGAC